MKQPLIIAAMGLLTCSLGCEHTGKKDDGKNAANKATNNDTVKEPVKTPPPSNGTPPTNVAQPANGATNPNGDAGGVRAPVAADLAEYVKDLKGSGPLMAKIETNKGTINCELFGDKAPMTVANFVGLATGKKPYRRKGQVVTGVPFYDGLIFHRVIPEFMIQGGDPDGRGSGGPGYEFAQETNTGIKHVPGVISMANAGPGTNGSQFFIMETTKDFLDGGYNAFGQCKEVDVVKTIARVPRNDADRPDADVVITKVTISRG